MSTKWSPQILGQTNNGSSPFGELFKDDYAIIFLQGKNVFGDLVYCYVKVVVPDIRRMYETLESGAGFNPSDFGTVVAAGRGDPSADVKGELALMYPMLSQPKPMMLPNMPPPPPLEKKAWDEY